MTSWSQQMTEIGLLAPAVDLTHIMDEAEFELPSSGGALTSHGRKLSAAATRPQHGADAPRPLADDPAYYEGGPPVTTTPSISTSVLDSTLRHLFLDDGGVSESDGDLPTRASNSDEDEDEDTAANSEAANPVTATSSSVQSESSHSTDARRKRKRKRTIDAELRSQSPARDAAAPLFAPSKSRRSRSDGTLVPAYPCARCIEKDIECLICYVGGACNVCRARGRKCDLVDPETKHTHTGSIAKNLVKRAGAQNSKGPAGKLKL